MAGQLPLGTVRLPKDATCGQRPEGQPQEGLQGAPRGSWHRGSFCPTCLGSADTCSTLPTCPCVCTHTHPHAHTSHPNTGTHTHSHAAWGDMLGFQGIPKYLTPTARQYPLLSTAQHTTLSQRHGHPSLLRNTGRRCLAQPSSALGSHRVTPQLSEAYIWDAG